MSARRRSQGLDQREVGGSARRLAAMLLVCGSAVGFASLQVFGTCIDPEGNGQNCVFFHCPGEDGGCSGGPELARDASGNSAGRSSLAEADSFAVHTEND